jgi:hypothetical protein
MSCALNKAELQKVHGPMPSFTQIIFPQFKQFGAASSKGCLVAMQLHFRLLLSCEARVGFVWISSALIADSRSFSAVEAPCIGVPPVTLTFAFAFGFVSDISWPGSFFVVGGAGETARDLGVDVPDDVVKVGNCNPSGCSDKPNLAAFDFELPAM